MFDIGKDDRAPPPKCYFSHTVLPSYIDSKQPPTKRKPFSTIIAQPFSHTLDLILPGTELENLREKLGNSETLQYARVHMKLKELLEGEFFNEYIKTGNISMLSEGRPGIDNNFSLHEGILRLELDRATYERCGLAGQPIRDHGRKHIKSRFAIELNLRLPSMVRGKKGFNRIVWAFENVLTQSLTWLFYDLRSPTDGSGPLAALAPHLHTVRPDLMHMEKVAFPLFPTAFTEDDKDDAMDLLEWLQLVRLDSPRVRVDDSVDSVLCRYSPPELVRSGEDGPQTSTVELVKLRWRGFIPAGFATTIFSIAIRAAGDQWFAMSAESFDRRSYTVLKDRGHAITWDCE